MGARLTPELAHRALAAAGADKAFVTLFQHGSLEIELYRPRGEDPQQPHRRDEIYVVISGHGVFFNSGERHPFAPGDVLFVPAGVAHRFEKFSDDFATWVFFYGPDGGEQKVTA